MSAPLNIFAGPGAMSVIRKHGFSSSLFRYFVGASGGPKWFVLAGLDRVLFPQFFKHQTRQLQVIGSSAGAFRAACMVQNDPEAAINRLAQHYANTVYSDKPTSTEITEKARVLLDDVMGREGIVEALSNDRFKLHIFVAKCRGLMKKHGRLEQTLGLGMSAAVNAISRKRLAMLYERYVFSAPGSQLTIDDPYGLKTNTVELGHNNLKDALLASGAIPVVLDGVEHIVGAPDGVYRDGGIIDYHFDLQFGPEPGLVMYPHFYDSPIPGWFDKMLPNRHVHMSSYHNVVMLVPSPAFVNSLPYQKIPDRKDFETMDAQQRITYWQTVLSETDRLGEYFMSLVDQGIVEEKIQPLRFRCR